MLLFTYWTEQLTVCPAVTGKLGMFDWLMYGNLLTSPFCTHHSTQAM